MYFNNIKTTYRHLLKNRAFSIINIFGLTIGFLCFIVIALYLHDELNFDRMHTDADRIYRVIRHQQTEEGVTKNVASVPGRIGPESHQQFPEIEEIMRISHFGSLTMGNDPLTRGYEELNVVDSTFFDFFDFKLLQGDPKTALTHPNGIVISQQVAIKYFNTEDALGKVIWANDYDLFVAGVMENFPPNSHLQLDILFTKSAVDTYFPFHARMRTSDWDTNSTATYLKLKSANIKDVENKITQLVAANYPPDKEFRSDFTLQPLQDIHLNSSNIEDYQVNISGFTPFYVYMFTVIAFLVLLIATLNYMNLSTAAAFKRTKEIGTRKTLGAGKLSLISQFLGEAILLSLVSLVIAIALLQIFIPGINAFTLKSLSISTLPINWMIAIAFTLIGSGVLASLYPAFVVSKVSPSEAIKKEIRFANRSIPVRKVLVIAQFAISIIMISSTLIIYKQLNYMRDKELGFDVENLVTIDINSGIQRRQFESIKNEFSKLPEVQSVTVSSRVPGEWKNFPVASVNLIEKSVSEEMIYVGVDSDFLETFDIQLKEGRNFNASSTADSAKVIVTQLAVDNLGLEDPIGQVISIPRISIGGRIRDRDVPFQAEVIGVVDNFYFESFRKEMMPLIMAYHNNPIHSIDYYTLRVKTRDWNNTLADLKRISANFDPINPIEYNFLDSKFRDFYESDAKRGQVFLVFSSIIILIACLGLFALVTFSIENRKKEIGVRKVLGASTNSIINLVSKEFIALVVIAFIIATPMVIMTMHNWLSEFAYKVNIGVGTFAVSGLITLFIATATISFHALKAANTNPVDALKSE
ncbi:MAG: ABC transporter permease [Cyclobacteriaceae bacterium]